MEFFYSTNPFIGLVPFPLNEAVKNRMHSDSSS